MWGFGIDVSFDSGATWRLGASAGYDGGGPVVDKHGTTIDWVEITLGSLQGGANLRAHTGGGRHDALQDA
jgi:hypothetical protein